MAEIVCIWTPTEDDQSVFSPHSVSTSPNSTSTDGCAVALEIRWFYRKRELPGAAKQCNNEKVEGSAFELEEIVESDHVEDLSAESLLAPANLFGTMNRSTPPGFFHGMPVLEFCCNRFRSVIRKALIPCGALSGRIARGRVHSRYIREDAVLRELLGVGSGNKTVKPQASTLSFENACLNVIQKLSLTDASKESSESTLIGREKEQRTIQGFLRLAIEGRTDDAGSSLFVAGPPGVG